MKFVALALALLLAVGSEAAALQNDAPSQLQHARSIMDLYMLQIKNSANKVLEQLDTTEYKDLKLSLSQRLEDTYNQIKALQSSISPVTDNVVTTIADATAELRASIDADIKALGEEIEPQRVKLREVVARHLEEYRLELEPIVKDYQKQHNAEMAALKLKLDPVVEVMKTKVAANVEETKAALMPIVESVRVKLYDHLQNLKKLITPYMEDYKEHLETVYAQAGAVNTEDLTAMKEKIAPMAEDVKAKVQQMIETVAATFNKS